MKDWRHKFIIDIREKYKFSQIEFQNYKKTSSVIYLQQACEKMFSVVENYFMVKYQYRAESYGDLRQKVKNNKHDSELLRKAFQLHKFFYNGSVQMPVYDAEDDFIYVSSLIEQRIKRLK